MVKKFLRGLFTILGGFLGFLIATLVYRISYVQNLNIMHNRFSVYILDAFFIILFGIILFLLSNFLVNLIYRLFSYVDKKVSTVPVMDLILGIMGGLLLLAIYYLAFNRFIDDLKYIGPILGIILKIVSFVLGVQVAVRKKEELLSILPTAKNRNKSQKKAEVPKVLDTSVIIDGRIFDVSRTGFIEGPLIIPSVVLEELRHIADSSDSLKRNRGRRGLDVLNRIQKELDIEVRIYEKEIKGAAEVDVKLLKLAKELGGKVVTNDYNLNKVAQVQGVEVLNINELANSVKPVLLPGEEMNLLVSNVGKEQNQGIGYLDDGTMIVVENGKKYVGKQIDIVVTTVLQTAAGRMIFARPKVEG